MENQSVTTLRQTDGMGMNVAYLTTVKLRVFPMNHQANDHMRSNMERADTSVIRKSSSTVLRRGMPRLLEYTAQSVGSHVTPIHRCGTTRIVPFSLDSETNPLSNASHSIHHQAPQRHHPNEPETTILVVEDDPDISMALQDLLEFEGFDVECVDTCRRAFSSIEQRTYDAVLLDLGLPDGDGRSVLKHLNDAHPTVPVIVLSAANRDLGVLHPYARLSKPWNREELCTILHRAISTASKNS